MDNTKPGSSKIKITPDEICPECGKSFHCSKSGKCWCYEVQLSPEKLAWIGEKYESCLCPDCLKKIAEKAI
jgi:hypothetical protein